MLHRHANFLAVFATLFLGLCLCPLAMADASQKDPVFVKNVRFSKEKLTSGGDPWLEIEVEIEGGHNLSSVALNQRFVDNVGVNLGLSFSLGSRPKEVFRFFRSEAHLPTIEERNRRSIFFYLPPEVVERDELREKPFAFMVEISVNGQILPTRRNNVSANLENIKQVADFKERMSSQAGPNDGVLLPIYQTPFHQVSQKLQVSPAFVQKTMK